MINDKLLVEKLAAINAKMDADKATATSAATTSSTVSQNNAREKAIEERVEALYQYMLPDLVRFFIENRAPGHCLVAADNAKRNGKPAKIDIKEHQNRFLQEIKFFLHDRITDPNYYQGKGHWDTTLLLQRLEYELNLPDSFWDLTTPCIQPLKPIPRTDEEMEKEIIIRAIAKDIHDKAKKDKQVMYDKTGKMITVYEHIFGTLTDNLNTCCIAVSCVISDISEGDYFPFASADGRNSSAQCKLYTHYKNTILEKYSALTQNTTVKPSASATDAATATTAAATTATITTMILS